MTSFPESGDPQRSNVGGSIESVMKLTFRRLSLTSAESFPMNDLRCWILEQLEKEGEPLRWAITSINPSSETSAVALEVEAVLINS